MNLEVIEHKAKTKSDKPPVLFVHGMWHGAWCWEDHFLPYFADHGYMAAAVSLRGHGKSEGRKGLRWSTIRNYAEDVARVAAGMARPPILVGHSMGGFVVQKVLETHPAPAAVLLASVPPGGILGPTLRVARKHPFLFAKVNLTLSLYPIVHTPALFKAFMLPPDFPEARLLKLFPLVQDESYRAYLDMIVFNLPRPKKVSTPLLVIGGEKDAAISVKEVHATAKAYNTQAEIIPGMTHDQMLDPQWEKVASRIVTWLDSLPKP